MSKLSFRARALDASKPMPIYLAEELPDLPDYSAINRAVPQMPSGMEKEEECEHHLQRAICTGLIIPTPEVYEVNDLEFYERCYPPDYKMPKQHIHMQPLWQEQETPEYDMDSEDEKWLKHRRIPELTELKFEQMMDKLERSSGQTVVTLNEAKLLLERNDDLIIAVYDYWLNKRLKTQHPLILSVKTESRPGQSSNNPYLAFRRRTEKMQTRKNRKNDESSYEKMLKLRRDLARALSLLELVARRERAKRELVKLTALLNERRYAAGDFANNLAPEPQPSPVSYRSTVGAPWVRREVPRVAPPPPLDLNRQREKRPYKRRKHRHHPPGSHALRDSGVYTSSEDEVSSRAETSSPPDDGPFAFRRKPGCYYEMPTSTLYGEPVDPENPSKDGLFEHEVDVRHRFTLTSIKEPHQHCVGFARRRVGRGGRLALDRARTPLDDLWPRLPFSLAGSSHYRREREEEVELETKAHRWPAALSRDLHSSGRHPWRHAFRQHLHRNPHLWTEVKDDATGVKTEVDGIKFDLDDVKLSVDDIKLAAEDVKLTDLDVKASDVRTSADSIRNSLDESRTSDDIRIGLDDIKIEPMVIDRPLQDYVHSDVKINSDISDKRTVLDNIVKENLGRVMRKRSWSECSDSSYDSDDSLEPVEKEFEKFIDEVNKKWLHFRPKTPPPLSPPLTAPELAALSPTAPLQVEITAPGDGLDLTTSAFTLQQLYPQLNSSKDADNSGSNLDLSGSDLQENLGLGALQVDSILSSADLNALDVDLSDKKISDDILDELARHVICKDPFLSQGQGLEGRSDSGPRPRATFGCSRVALAAPDKEPILIERPECKAEVQPVKKIDTPKEVKRKEEIKKQAVTQPSPVPNSKIIVEEVNEVPSQIRETVTFKKKEVNLDEGKTEEIQQIAHGIQLKTVQTKHSPLKKHIITSHGTRRPVDLTSEQITRTHTDGLKVRLQNQVITSVSGNVVGLLHSGLQSHAEHTGGVTVAVPVQQTQRQEQAGGVTTMTQVVNATNITNVASIANITNVASIANITNVANVSVASSSSPRRVSTTPLVHLAPAALAGHQKLQISHQPLVVAQSHHLHHVAPNKLKVLHAHPLTQTQRTQLLQTRTSGIGQLPTVVSLATIDAKSNTALLKAAPGSVAQFFEIKSGQLGKGPHLVNVVRQPQPGKTTVARLDLNEAKKRQIVATFDGTLKGNIATTGMRPQRVSVSLDGRAVVRGTVPIRAPIGHQIHLKNRTLQVASPQVRVSEASTSLPLPAGAPLAAGVVANLLHKAPLAPPRARPAPPAPAPPAPPRRPANTHRDLVEATASGATSSTSGNMVDNMASNDGDDSVRRPSDNLPMEVT